MQQEQSEVCCGMQPAHMQHAHLQKHPLPTSQTLTINCTLQPLHILKILLKPSKPRAPQLTTTPELGSHQLSMMMG